ncbi:MAG: hypothetical protein GX621_09045 [Pirellulaceae bacterium]|nr:hypothetical protein [Pirellulaceae bacterium]
MKWKWVIIAAFLTAMLALPVVATAEIIANFEGRAGTLDVDGYKGKTGLGWSGAWVEKGSGTGSVVGTLMTPTTPGYTAFDSDNDQYLRIRTTLTSGTNYKGSINRNYTHSSGDVDFTQPYRVSLSVRPEDLTNWEQSATNDSFRIFDILGTNSYDRSATSTRFYVSANGGPTSPYNSTKHCWLVSDGTSSITTYVYIADGHIYDFVIDVFPDTKTWDVTITDRDFALADINPAYYDGVTTRPKATYTKEGLNWYAAGATGTNAPTAISVAVYEGIATGGALGKYNTMSVDDIRIAEIPEPTSVAMGLGLLLAGLMVRRRK